MRANCTTIVHKCQAFGHIRSFQRYEKRARILLIPKIRAEANSRLKEIRTGTEALPTSLQYLTYDYDSLGNVAVITDSVASETLNFSYDHLDRLIQVTGAMAHTFAYDGNGQRAKKVEDGVTTIYIGDYYEVNLSTGEVTKYYYAGSRWVAMRKGNALYWIHGDHLRYDPYGSGRYSWGITPTAYKFTGQRLNESRGPSFRAVLFFRRKKGRKQLIRLRGEIRCGETAWSSGVWCGEERGE